MKVLRTKPIRSLAVLAAAALLLACCGEPADSMSGASGSSGSAGASGPMSGSSGADGAAGDWKAGLAVLSEGEARDAGGELNTIAAAVLLDGEGRILHAVVDELEAQVTADEAGVALPGDLRTKRQKGDEDYPLSAVSGIGKSWAEQADALARHLEGMTASEVADIVAIAEMTPGPLGFNCATFAGIQAAGIPGAIAANLGVMSPTLTLCAAAAAFFERVKGNKYMEHILVGVRPACLGMVVGVTCSMLTNYLGTSGQVSLPAVGIGVLDLVLLLKGKQSVPVVIGISALLGLLCFGVLGWQ